MARLSASCQLASTVAPRGLPMSLERPACVCSRFVIRSVLGAGLLFGSLGTATLPARAQGGSPAASAPPPVAPREPSAAPVYNTYPEAPQAAAPAPAPLVAEPPPVSRPPESTYGQYAPPPGYPQPIAYQRPLSRPPGPGSHEHEGFFLRISAGGGAGGMTYKERFNGSVQSSNVKTRGLAAAFELALGGRVVENFIVHANLSLVGTDSRREINSVKDNSYDSIGTTFWLLGAGATYYFMPSNLYLTLVLGTGGMVERRDYGIVGRDDNQIETGAGFASSLAIGKEWWVGGRGDWGIGASITGAVYAAPIDVAGVKSTAVGHSITLAFSATLN
jgi:hypothetical protein